MLEVCCHEDKFFATKSPRREEAQRRDFNKVSVETERKAGVAPLFLFIFCFN
jgi:hypothetical protein